MPFRNITHINHTGINTPFTYAAGFAQTFNGTFFNPSAVPPEYLDSRNYPTDLGFRPTKMPNANSQLRRLLCPNSTGLLTESTSGRHLQSYSCIYMHNVYTLPSFALYNMTPETLKDLLDPQVLAKTYGAAFKLLFAIAVAQELVDSSGVEAVIVTRDAHRRGFTVNVPWARCAQGGLVTVAMMAVVLAMISRRRSCRIGGEPNSLAAGLQLLAASQELCAQLEGAEFRSQEELSKMLVRSGNHYQLIQDQYRARIEVVNGSKELINSGRSTYGSIEPWKENTLWTLRTSSGVVILISLGFVALLLLTAYWRAWVQSSTE